jgi:predicted GNAT family N-acyltransferase
MRRAVEDASRSGAKSAVLHAQISASAFYERLGFSREGDDFMEADIPHCRMMRSLP